MKHTWKDPIIEFGITPGGDEEEEGASADAPVPVNAMPYKEWLDSEFAGDSYTEDGNIDFADYAEWCAEFGYTPSGNPKE